MPVPRRERRERLAALQSETRTILLYEAPHKLRTTLDDLAAALGAERPVTVCRELTKLHEQIVKTTLGEAHRLLPGKTTPGGEYVLVVAGAAPAAVQDAPPTREDVVAAARALQAGGLPAGRRRQTGRRRHALPQRRDLQSARRKTIK